MLKRILLCVSLLGADALGASAKAPEAETRTHYIVATRDRMPVYHVTVISTNGETLGSETYLLEDPSGQRIRIDVRKSYKNRLVTAEYSLNDGRSVKVKLELPGNATTRSETLKQYREHPELRNADVPVTVESPGQLLKTGEKEWKSGKSDVRDKAKAIAGSAFVSAVGALSSVLGFPQFAGACSTFEFVSDGQKCTLSTSLMTATMKPDCDFDAKFGMPCDSAQKLRAKEQPKNGKVASY